MTSEKGIDSEDQTTPDNLEDTDEIRCICGDSDDDGYTIQCDNCFTWQHIKCMKVDPNVKEYKCHNCSDIKVEKSLRDGKKSKKYQKIRRETDSGVYSSPAPQMGESSIIGTSNKSRNRSSDLSFVMKERQSSHSKEYEPIEKNIITSKAVEELFPKIYSQYQHRKRSMSLSSTSKTDNEHNRDDNQETLSIRSTSPSLEIGNPFNMEKESLARPFMKTIVKQVRSKMLKKNSNCYGLFAETNISPGLFIVEFKGEVCLKSDYKANESNQYSLLGVTQPFVLFYPVLNLCVDARRVGTEARFIRRSCHPNAETRTIVVPGGDEVHLGIFSKFEILKGREITIGWDWESNHIANSLIQLQESVFENDDDENTLAKKRDEIGKTTAAILRLTECACENKDDCIIYKMQNEGKTLSKSRKNKKLVMDVEEMLIEGEKETSPGINDEDYEDDMDSSQKKRDNVSYTRKINRKGKQNAESSLNGNNKNFSEENEVSNQIGRKDKKRMKESDAKSDNIAPYSQKNKGKESANRVREETSGNIKRKSLSSRKSTSSRHVRSTLLSSSKRRQQHEDDEEQLSDSSLSSVNSEMSLDDDTSIVEVSPSADKNIPNEHINKENNEDQLSEHSIETEVNDILLQSSATPPRPLPPAISQIPFKDYLIQMHEWKKAIEAISNSVSTESDRPSSSILHESNMETTSENVEPENIGKSKGLKSHDEDLITDKDEEVDHDQRLVPLPTPIIPAKRVASSPGPTLNNQNGKYLYNENGSDIKGKRQKTEELQGLSKGKGKETEIEKEEVQSSTPDNRDNVESTILMKTSGDLKKQVMDSSITHSSTNETSKTMTSKPRKLSLNEYRSQLAITALNKETLEKKSTAEDSKSPISSATEIDKKDNKTIDNNDTSSSLPVNASIKTKLSLKEYQDKIRLAESSNNSSVDAMKKSIDLVPTNTEELKQKSDVIENKQINEQTKSEEVVDLTVISTSPKSPKLPKTEDNKSSLINDGYFPDVDFRFDFPITPLDTSKDINAFTTNTTNEFGRHANSSHSDGSYEETRGRHSPYKDYSSMKSSGNYNSSYNIPLGDTSMQTSPRPEHTSPPRGPRYYGGGHFRGNRMGGSYRGMSMSPGDRGRYHSGSGYFNSAGSLPATPRQGAQSSMMTSSASSPYDPANPDGQSANTSNERDPILDNNSIMGNNSGSGIAMESKARDFARSGGDRSDLRDRWSYNNYASMDRSREREWRERERDDGRKDWNNKRLDHYREREYTGTSELPRYPMMVTRRHSNQDRYMIGGSVPTGPAAGMNPSPSGISKNSEQPSSSNNPSQRFGVDDHRRNRR